MTLKCEYSKSFSNEQISPTINACAKFQRLRSCGLVKLNSLDYIRQVPNRLHLQIHLIKSVIPRYKQSTKLCSTWENLQSKYKITHSSLLIGMSSIFAYLTIFINGYSNYLRTIFYYISAEKTEMKLRIVIRDMKQHIIQDTFYSGTTRVQSRAEASHI